MNVLKINLLGIVRVAHQGIPTKAGMGRTVKGLLGYRTRYFTDSGIIGSKAFVFSNYQRFKHLFYSRHEKKPKPIKGLDGIYSFKRLSEMI